MFNLMWQDMTMRMHKAGVHTMTLTRQTRELQDRFLGSAVSYDAASKFLPPTAEGASAEITSKLQQGLGVGMGQVNTYADAVLAAALFRNVFDGGCTAQQLEAMVCVCVFVRRGCNSLICARLGALCTTGVSRLELQPHVSCSRASRYASCTPLTLCRSTSLVYGNSFRWGHPPSSSSAADC